MKIKRRRLAGRPLLAAAGGATLMVGCVTGANSGNLVAPPTVELCVEVEPPEAEADVFVDGVELEGDGCNEVYEGPVTVEAAAEGYRDYAETLEVYGSTTHVVELVEE